MTRTIRMLGSSAAVALTEPVAPVVPSVVRDMPRDAYDAIRDRINFSTLKLMERSPAHYRERILNPPGPDSDAMRVGRATHLAVLEPSRFDVECVRWDGGVRRGAKWDEFEREHHFQEILTPAEWDACLAMQRAVRASDAASRFLMEGAPEVTVLWTLDRSVEGFPPASFDCKGRVDWLGSSVVDLKTTRDASPKKFGRACFDLGYLAQAAFYVDGIEAVTGEALPFVVIAVESSAPWVVQPYRIPDEYLDIGRETYWRWLDRLDLCRRENRWPGYGDDVLTLELPPWALKSDEDVTGLDLSF